MYLADLAASRKISTDDSLTGEGLRFCKRTGDGGLGTGDDELPDMMYRYSSKLSFNE